MRSLIAILLVALVPGSAIASWNKTKNQADDIIYDDRDRTFYCGCEYASHKDSDGSGGITNVAECGYSGPDTHSHRAGRVEWEHIVPASLTPARQEACWSNGRCMSDNGVAGDMVRDLHNLAPSIGQVNALRSDDRFADLEDDVSDFAGCQIEDTRDAFEPPDCKKGDVARIWFYMHDQYGVVIPDEERAMFEEWSAKDPVSPWEKVRERRVAGVTGVSNPHVADATIVFDDAGMAVGACSWE